ncbi:MAG: integration host factor subunit beta [Comamonas sp.]|jgi:integration host factor subunit beta|nr:integration host factor subunit beta [Comamonas sp.]
MTRSDLVEALAAQLPFLMQRDAEQAVKALQDAIVQALVNGQRIEIRGFGSFSVTHRPARIGRNPRSGAAVEVPAKRTPHFKPGKAMREAVDAPPAA